MGQCVSNKAASALAATHNSSSNRPFKMKKHLIKLQSPDDDATTELSQKKQPYTKGVAMSFGFKRRPVTAPTIASNSNAARRMANNPDNLQDTNGNDEETTPLTSHAVPSGRSTPRLVPPKKEGSATRVSRFGFRQPQANRMNKVADLNGGGGDYLGNGNNNFVKQRPTSGRPLYLSRSTDNNRNKLTAKAANVPQVQSGKYTLHTNQLPRPEPVRLIETKAAKTLANTSMKNARISYRSHEDNSSKDGSLTEDSGVGSHIGGGMDENDAMPDVEPLSSASYNSHKSYPKPRSLGVVLHGNTFDVRDLEDTGGRETLPHLPNAFIKYEDNRKSTPQRFGFVRERALEYQRQLDIDNRSKNSVTSSEGEEDKTYKDKYRSEKTFLKPGVDKTFLKSTLLKDDSSPPSSDEHEWAQGGEAMADEVTFSFSSSDESKDRLNLSLLNSIPFSSKFPRSSTPTEDFKNVSLTIEDTKFAALAASITDNVLLEDETSPVDSLLSYSESDDPLKRKINKSSSNSKDINEKLTPPSPGTPTNASNSLSLSDAKDEFLIDDEIADQPALLFETSKSKRDLYGSLSLNNSENTLVDSTPKLRRKKTGSGENSPLPLRNKKFAQSRTGSLDTLSPCESIASDDLMMDYDFSQSSGLDECDRRNTAHEDTIICNKSDVDFKSGELIKNWAIQQLTTKPTSKNRLLLSRTGTPSSIPDSPRSLDSRINLRQRNSTTGSPLRHPRVAPLSAATGYDSDDSIRLDRTHHAAIKQDILGIKTMLLKLKRVLNEQANEEFLLRSETHNLFESQSNLANGLLNGLCSVDAQSDEIDDSKLELAELRRQVLFLQGQLEDKERVVHDLQEQVVRISNENYSSNSAPASTIVVESNFCNAATQTERLRPISAGPSLLNGAAEGEIGSFVSASESGANGQRLSMQTASQARNSSTNKLRKKPGDQTTPLRYSSPTSIPRRAASRSRESSMPS